MSLTLQQIITDAKRLANRLKDRDVEANILINETQAIHKNIDEMKQFQEEVEELNNLAYQKPHSQIKSDIQKENRHLRELKQENRELRAALEDYQNTLEHIMTKYRQHTTEQIFKSRINFKALYDQKYHDVIQEQTAKIEEMTAIMGHAAQIDEENNVRDQELVSRLKAENQGLKEMLQISAKYGNLKTEDKNVQTESTT